LSHDNERWRWEKVNANSITGSPPSKLTLGIATYGRSYTLSDVSQTGIGAPVSGIGRKSAYLSNNPGVVPFAEICANMLTANDAWTFKFDDGHFANYAVFDDDQWVSYDSKKTVLAKIHLAIEKELGGLNYATIDRDDFCKDFFFIFVLFEFY
jgi:chitinase